MCWPHGPPGILQAPLPWRGVVQTHMFALPRPFPPAQHDEAALPSQKAADPSTGLAQGHRSPP